MSQKNSNPRVLSSSDARIEGQIQIEDSVVIDPRQNGTGNPVVLQADANSVTVNGQEVVVLDAEGKLDPTTFPSISLIEVTTVTSEAAQLALTAEAGDVAVRTDIEVAYMHNGGDAGDLTDWTRISFAPVASVAGKVGEVTLEKADITDFDDADYAAASHSHTKAEITDLDESDYATASHSHTKADITDLNDADYAAASHSHTKAEITDFAHTHTKADITDLDETDYAAAAHTHTKADITDLDETDYAAASHTHAVADITDLNDRATMTQVVTVAADAEAEVSLPLAPAFGMWKLSTDKAARVRVYSTAADRTADASRAEGDLPAAGVGLVTEVITSASLLSVPLTPPQFGASLETTPSSSISALVKNKSASADITITIIWTPFG